MARIHVVRKATIEAPPEKVYQVVRDFSRWADWAPWYVAEPDCKRSHDSEGCSWAGRFVGEGSIRVVGESRPGSMDWEVNFLKPHKAVARVRFGFEKTEGGTEVSWSMDSTLPIFLFMMKGRMEAFIGMDYERGLDRLKAYIEKGRILSRQEFCGIIREEGFSYVGIREKSSLAEIGTRVRDAFRRFFEWQEESGTEPGDRMATLYHGFDLAGKRAEFTAAAPLERIPDSLPDNIVSGRIPAGRVYAVRHRGSYNHLGDAWAAGHAHAKEKAFTQDPKAICYEIYENDPQEVPEEDWSTLVCLPAR